MFTHFIALDTNQIVIRGELFEHDYKILEEEVDWAIWRRKISFDIYVLLFSLNDKMSRIFKKTSVQNKQIPALTESWLDISIIFTKQRFENKTRSVRS